MPKNKLEKKIYIIGKNMKNVLKIAKVKLLRRIKISKVGKFAVQF
jgi:hypothetical protein